MTATDNRRRWLALVVLCLGDLMIVLDTTIVNVALPSIREDLGFSESSLAWVVNAYLLTFGGFLLLGGRLGDLYGHRRLFLVGLAVFTSASLACGLAGSQAFLVAARAVQIIEPCFASLPGVQKNAPVAASDRCRPGASRSPEASSANRSSRRSSSCATPSASTRAAAFPGQGTSDPRGTRRSSGRARGDPSLRRVSRRFAGVAAGQTRRGRKRQHRAETKA